jgi:multidrug efflux pump subunit AcrA (membrane-fusion protein)
MTNRTRASWLVYALGALAIGAIIAAFLVVGPASQSATAQTRIVTVEQGVVQSTVSGSGNIQAATQLNLGFKTAGVVQHIYVSAGQHVTPGQLLAELSPQSSEVTLEQSKAALQAAEATLVQLEENGGETSGAGASGGASGSTGTGTAGKAASVSAVSAATPAASVAPASTTPATTTTSPSPVTSRPTRTSTSATPTPAASTTPAGKSGSGTGTSTTSTTSTEKPKQSEATREANLASAHAAVKSDRLAVQSDEQAVSNTKLYAPISGTIVSLSGEVGESVSGTGTSRASSTTSSSSSSSAGATGGSAAGRSAGAAASSSSGSGSSSSSSFAVLSDLSTMQLVVPLSESEVVHVQVGQPATVTIEALEGMKLAAHVVSVATLSSSNSGVVSYNVTFQLDQAAANVKPGMSATAEVVVKQEEGVNVPTSAISGRSVTVVSGSKRERRAVVTGLAGNSSTIILSGLKAGEQIALPIASTSSATSLTSRLGSRLGGAGLGGALSGAGSGGFAARGGG